MGVGVQVASLFGLIDIDDKLTPGLEKARGGMSSFGSTLSSNLKNMGNQVAKVGAGVTAIGLPFAGMAISAISAAGESQLALAQLNSVLESTQGAAGLTIDQLANMANGLQSQTRYGDEAVMSAEALLLTFTNLKQDTFPGALQSVLDMSTAMGQDLSSSAILVGKALNDPLTGLSALTRIGVTFTDGQKSQIAAMMAAGDVAGAQKLILQELQKELGGSAVAAGQTFPGQLDILKNKFGEVQEKLGSVLINILTPMTGTLGDVADGFAGLPQPVQEALGKVVLLGGAMALAGPVISGVGLGIKGVGSALGLLLTPAGLAGVAIAGIILLADKHYPGGLPKMLSDAALSAQRLAAIFLGSLSYAADQINKKFTDAMTAVSGVTGIIDLLTTGKVTPADVINAIGQEVAGNPGSVLRGLFTKVPVDNPANWASGGGERGFGMSYGEQNQWGGLIGSGGGLVPNTAPGTTMNFHGPVTVNANNWHEFEDEFINRSQGRG